MILKDNSFHDEVKIISKIFFVDYSAQIPSFNSHWDIEDSLNEETEAFDAPEWIQGYKATIYVIDANLTKFDDEKEAFKQCLDCIEADMLKSILESPKDLAAILFYNTEKSTLPKRTDIDLSSFSQSENCSIFLPLAKLCKDSILHLKNFIQSDDYFDFENEYGTSDKNSFVEILWMCSKMLSLCRRKLSSTNILVFTNDEQPYTPGSTELQQTYIRAKDLCEINAEISIVPCVDVFDYDLFFKEFLCIANDTDIESFRAISPIEQRRALLSRFFQRNSGRTCNRHLLLKVTKDIGISCDVHSFIQKAWKPKTVQIHRDTNEVVVSKRGYFVKPQNDVYAGIGDDDADINDDDDDGFNRSRTIRSVNNNPDNEPTRVLPGEYIMYQEICGKAIAFEPDELKKLKLMLRPGINLLGFKPIETLKPRFFIKHCQFLYPNDKWIDGSTKLFRALWEKCLEKRKYALCTLILRRADAPNYIALVPQTQDEHGNDGFKIVYLPYEGF